MELLFWLNNKCKSPMQCVRQSYYGAVDNAWSAEVNALEELFDDDEALMEMFDDKQLDLSKKC